METKTLRVDTAFAGLADQELTDSLSSGWYVFDKNVMKERWIYYILARKTDPDVGKTDQSED